MNGQRAQDAVRDVVLLKQRNDELERQLRDAAHWELEIQ